MKTYAFNFKDNMNITAGILDCSTCVSSIAATIASLGQYGEFTKQNKDYNPADLNEYEINDMLAKLNRFLQFNLTSICVHAVKLPREERDN